jgi:hypothetical protein
MIVAPIRARVFQINKVCKKFKVSIRSHRVDSVLIQQNRAKLFCTLTRTHTTQKSNRYQSTRRAIALGVETARAVDLLSSTILAFVGMPKLLLKTVLRGHKPA